MSGEQISFIGKEFMTDEQVADLERQTEIFLGYARKKRNWENAFQKWSDENGMSDGLESWGACGFGSMCEYCEDNSYGRPCIRALNAMCREKGIRLDYSDRDFERIWEDGK